MRRLEDKIRGLCARAINAEGEEDLKPLLSELRDALRQHVERIRKRFADYPPPVERRVNDEGPPSGKLPTETPLSQSTPSRIKPIDLDSISSQIKKTPNGPANGTPSS